MEEREMDGGEQGSRGFHALRQSLQKVMRRLNPRPGPASDARPPASTQQLLYRLHHYQAELEKRNEELRLSQRALEESQVRFVELLEYTSDLYNLAPIGYLTLSGEGTIVEANLAAAELFGLRRERLLHRPLINFVFAEDHDYFTQYCKQLLNAYPSPRCQVRILRADGSHFFAQIDATVARVLPRAEQHHDSLVNNQYVRITISDISARVHLELEERKVRTELEAALTDLHQAQAQMVKQERLAVVGQLAAGIAHDFNNILASITLYSELVMRSSDLPDHLQKRMAAIVDQTNRAALLIQQILDFSRRAVMTREPAALCGFMQRFVELLRHTLPETIEVTLTIDSLQPGVDDIVEMDPARMQQVLLNLALNARDAMPNGGVLRLSVDRIVSNGTLPAVASGILAPGQWLRIEVNDNGVGIPADHLPHLFEPFFTTKNIGQGSGLGLSQVWGIITHHDGEIDVASEVGIGTTVSLYLPARPIQPVSPSGETTTLPHGQGELVVVVEDNDDLRSALVSAITQLGYRPLDAKNGKEAAEIVHQEGDAVKLLISDLIMPVMGGEELIRMLRSQRWEKPVVILSGSPITKANVEELSSYGLITWLQKPPTLDQLAHAINHSLRARAT
jgi:PAS domain S-box-containing protein